MRGVPVPRQFLVALAAGSALTIAACGGSAQTPIPTQPAAKPAAPSPATTPPAAPPATATIAAPSPVAKTAAAPTATPPAAPTATASPAAATPSAAASPVAGQLATSAIVPAPAGATCWDVQPGSTATYQISETAARVARLATVTGVTPDVGGTICFRDGQIVPESSRVLVGLAALKTDSDRRDEVVRGNNMLRTATSPFATFRIDRIDGVGAGFPADGPANGRIVGTFTMLGVERPLTFDAQGDVKGDIITGRASTTIKPSDFGVTVPDIANVVKVEDEAVVSIDFTAQRRGAGTPAGRNSSSGGGGSAPTPGATATPGAGSDY